MGGSVGKPGAIVSRHGRCFMVADKLPASATKLELSCQGGFKSKEYYIVAYLVTSSY